MARVHSSHGRHAALIAKRQLCHLATLPKLVLRVSFFDTLKRHTKHLRSRGLIDLSVSAENLKPPLLICQPRYYTGFNGREVSVNEDVAFRRYQRRTDKLRERIVHVSVNHLDTVKVTGFH